MSVIAFRVAVAGAACIVSCAGTAAVANKVVKIEGASCDSGGTFSARVFYPTDSSKRYPVLSFGTGAFVTDGIEYRATISGVAAEGYVVIAPGGCASPFSSGKEWKEQIASIVYMLSKEASLESIIDHNAPTGIFGHAMGAEATLDAASNAAAIQEANVVVAVALHPGERFRPQPPVVPTLYLAGDLDFISAPNSVKAKYSSCVQASLDCGFAVFKGASHTTVVGRFGTNVEIAWVVAMMNCKVKNITAACDEIFRRGQASMCENKAVGDCETHSASHVFASIPSISV